MTTKAEIRTQVQALLNRNDVTTDLLNTFIDQAVSRIQRTLRVPAMEKAYVYEIGETDPGTLSLPIDFLNIKFLYVDGQLLEFLDLGTFLSLGNATGTPKYYTRIQGALKLFPAPVEDSEVTMVYYGEIADLTSDSSVNFLTEIAPDLLVYGALTFASIYYIDERKPGFEAEFDRIYQEIEEQARLTEMEQSAMRVLPAYSNY